MKALPAGRGWAWPEIPKPRTRWESSLTRSPHRAGPLTPRPRKAWIRQNTEWNKRREAGA